MSARSVLLTVLAVVSAVVLTVAYSLDDLFDDPKVSEVATFAQQDPDTPPALAVALIEDGIGFPNWTRWGWTPVGGRTDPLEDDGRRAVTLLYRKGDDRIAYSIVSGTEDVNSDQGGRSVIRTPPEGKVGLDLSAVDERFSVETGDRGGRCGDGPCRIYSGSAVTIKRKINGRSVILTAWPVSDELSREAQDMALRTKTR